MYSIYMNSVQISHYFPTYLYLIPFLLYFPNKDLFPPISPAFLYHLPTNFNIFPIRSNKYKHKQINLWVLLIIFLFRL